MYSLMGDRFLKEFVGTVLNRIRQTSVDMVDAMIELETITFRSVAEDPIDGQAVANQANVVTSDRPDEPGALQNPDVQAARSTDINDPSDQEIEIDSEHEKRMSS